MKIRLPQIKAAICSVLVMGLHTPAHGFDAFRFNVSTDDSALRDKLSRTSLLRSAFDEGLDDAFEVFTLARAEYGQLIGTFYEAGFFAPVISVRIDGREAADISPLAPPARIGQITVSLDPGPAFVFGRAQLGPVADGTDLPQGFASGAPARSTTVRDAAGAAVDGWRALGHAKAEPVAQNITARHPARALDVDVTIAPGPRFVFGDLNPDGQERTRRERIVEIAGLPTGEEFNPRDLERASARLRRTGTFSSVALREAESGNPDGSLDINASVVEAPLRRIGVGVEYDTEAGGKLSGFWLHRNLFGGAERFRVEGHIGGVGARRERGLNYKLSLDFARPATFTPDTTFKLGASIETDEERDYTASRLRFDMGLTHLYSDTLSFSGGVGVLIERADFGPDKSIRRDFRLLLLPLSVEWDRRNDPRNPSSGYYLSGELTPFLGITGSQSGARAFTEARAYRGFGEDDQFVLAARAQLGAVYGPSLDRTPRDFLFYSGGGGTVRGHPFRSLGVESGGVRSGGQGFAALSGEVRMRATETIGLAAFVDAGYVSEGVFSGQSDWHSGAGLGLRYDTPIGPLRLDVGYPVSGSTGRGFQLYLGIGQAF